MRRCSGKMKSNASLIAIVISTSMALAESCGFPGSPAHAKLHTSDDLFREGTLVTFECDAGYRLLGRSSLRCVNSEWDSPGLPYCAREVAFRKPAGMSSRTSSASSAVDDDRRTCAESAFGTAHHWWVDLLEQDVAVNVVEVHFGMELANATVSIVVGNRHHTDVMADNNNSNNSYNIGLECATSTGIYLDSDQARYFSCVTARRAHPETATETNNSPRGSHNDDATANGDDNERNKITPPQQDGQEQSHAAEARGRFVTISVGAVHSFSLRLCEVSVYTQDLYSPADVCGEAEGKIESFGGRCYEVTPRELSFDESTEFCSKGGGQLWPTVESGEVEETCTEVLSGDAKSNAAQSDDQDFIFWMMDVHKLERVWTAISTRETTESAKENSTKLSLSTLERMTMLPDGNHENATTSKVPNGNGSVAGPAAGSTRAESTGSYADLVCRVLGVHDPREVARSLEAAPAVADADATNHSGRDRIATVSCNQTAFGVCKRPAYSCGRPALPKRMASWKAAGPLLQGEQFSAFECEEGYYLSGPRSIQCQSRDGRFQQQHQQIRRQRQQQQLQQQHRHQQQCVRSACGAPPLVPYSFAVLNGERPPHLRCVNDSFVLHGNGRLECDITSARWTRPVAATCIQLPNARRYHHHHRHTSSSDGIDGASGDLSGLAEKLAQGIEIFPCATRVGLGLLLATFVSLMVLAGIACVNLIRFFRVVKPRLDRQSDSSAVLSKMHDELHADEIAAAGTSQTSPAASNVFLTLPSSLQTTDELELSHEDARVITRVSTESTESQNRSQKTNSSTPNANGTPKLRLNESPIRRAKRHD